MTSIFATENLCTEIKVHDKYIMGFDFVECECDMCVNFKIYAWKSKLHEKPIMSFDFVKCDMCVIHRVSKTQK